MTSPSLRDYPWLPIVECASDAILVAAPQPWRLLYANPKATFVLGLTPETIPSAPLQEVLDQCGLGDWMGAIEGFWASEGEKETLAGQFIGRGAWPTFAHVCRLELEGLTVLALLFPVPASSRSDPAQSDSDRLDPLTELPDRTFLLARLAALMEGDRSADREFAVLFVDLDNFKQVNDQQGHLIGDRVLREVARRLVDCVREGDHVARFGGDEFVVLVERVGAHAEIDSIIRRIHAVLAKPIALPDGEVTLSVSIGAAEPSPEHASPEDMLAAADRAMYAAKRMNG